MNGKKPSLKHLRVWGCSSEIRLYNPHKKKLDPRAVNGLLFFIGYPKKKKKKKSKGYKF